MFILLLDNIDFVLQFVMRTLIERRKVKLNKHETAKVERRGREADGGITEPEMF